MNQIAKKPQLFILFFLISFAAVGAVIFTPGLPIMAEHYKISISAAQKAVSLFLLGYAIGQLPYGPIANRFGRKKALYMGLFLHVFGAICTTISAFFFSYPFLLVFIFIMALGSSVGLKMSYTMIGDCYNQNEATKRIAYLGISFALSPNIGVAIGGFIVNYFNWQSTYVLLTMYGIFLLILALFLPETGNGIDKNALRLKRMLRNFFDQLKDVRFIFAALLWGSSTAFAYLFAAMAPFIGIQRIGLNPREYGLLYFVSPIGIISASFLLKFLVDKVAAHKIMLFGIFIGGIGVSLQLIFFAIGKVNLWSLFFPMPLIFFGFYLVSANASAIGITCAENKSIASSLMNFINMGTAFLWIFVLELIPYKESIILPILYLVLTFVILGLYLKFINCRSRSV